MKILVTGNPNYEGLCKGIYEAYNRNFVEFIEDGMVGIPQIMKRWQTMPGPWMYLLTAHMVLTENKLSC